MVFPVMNVEDDYTSVSTSIADEAEDSLYPIAVLLDELKNENVELRLNATARIKIIARALGPERTRSELIPFLSDTVDDEDEVLMTLAEELGDFLDEIGGVVYAGVLTDALEALSAIEETMVREKAVESLKKISRATSHGPDEGRDFHVNYMFPLVKRLATGDWFTIRISACALLPPCYSGVPKERADLRNECLVMFKALAEDDTPMVRRAATCNIGMMARAAHGVSAQLVETEIFPIFKQLARDDQDSVRLLIVEMAGDIARLLPKPGAHGTSVSLIDDDVSPLIESDLIPVLQACVGDTSWRVRYMAADKMAYLCSSFGVRATWKALIPLYIQLLKDAEPEVRTAAAYKVNAVTTCLIEFPNEKLPQLKEGGPRLTSVDHVINHILPVVKELINDPSQHVRAAFALNIMGLAPVLGRDVALKEVLDLIMVLLKDEVPDVRLNIIAHLDRISTFLGPKRLSSELLPAITELAQDKNWRVRSAIIHHMPSLAKQLGRDYFVIDNTLGALCVTWLKDCVFAIRQAAMNNLALLTKEFGVEWAKEHIVPQVLELFKESKNYLYRIAALSTMGVLSKELGADVVENSFLSIMTEDACKDAVPNVRFQAAKILDRVIPIVGPNARESKIRPCLMALAGRPESDVDVKFFASQALETLSACG